MSETKDQSKTKEDVLQLDKNTILNSINKDKKYETEGCLIRRWEGVDDTDSFISCITNGKAKFIGILNGKLEREGYGINTFENGDTYFGYFENDKREKHGIYFWPTEEKNGHLLTECYYGFWKENKKDHHGIYLWMNEPKGNTEFEQADFDAYVGTIVKDKFHKGTYLSKQGDDYYLYHGGFDSNGKKSDNNAFFYSARYDRLIMGKIVEDVFVNGYVSFYDSDSGEISDMVYAEFEGKDNIKAIKQRNEIPEEERKAIEEKLNLFRGVILGIDYFGNLYEKYKEISNFIETDMHSIDVLDDKEKFPAIIRLCVGYNENNIYSNIEKLVTYKK